MGDAKIRHLRDPALQARMLRGAAGSGRSRQDHSGKSPASRIAASRPPIFAVHMRKMPQAPLPGRTRRCTGSTESSEIRYRFVTTLATHSSYETKRNQSPQGFSHTARREELGLSRRRIPEGIRPVDGREEYGREASREVSRPSIFQRRVGMLPYSGEVEGVVGPIRGHQPILSRSRVMCVL